MSMYGRVLRPLLFRADAEWIHDRSIRLAASAGSSASLNGLLAKRFGSVDRRLAIDVKGLRLSTPLGLAAGYDKNARAVNLLSALGFGHVEVGSISADPSAGNPKPRLFRLREHEAIVVYYGLPNDGANRSPLAWPSVVPSFRSAPTW